MKELLYDPSVLRHQACMVDTDSSDEYLLELGPGPLREVVGFDAFGQDGLPFFVDQLLALGYDLFELRRGGRWHPVDARSLIANTATNTNLLLLPRGERPNAWTVTAARQG